MPAVAERIPAFVQQSAETVFQTMVNLQTKPVPAGETSSEHVAIDGIAGSVGFAGRSSGILYFILSEALANRLTQLMLGEDAPIGSAEVFDVVGELTNMITGGLKSRLADAGFNCVLTIPTLMRAENVMVQVKSANISVAHRFRIASLDEHFAVRVFLRLET